MKESVFCKSQLSSHCAYRVATISRLLKTIRLFCKRALLKRVYSAKETGRAAARRTAPKLPRVITVGPNEGGQDLGPNFGGLSDF